MEPAWFYARFSAYAVVVQLGDFVELLTVGVGVSLTLLPSQGTLFFLVGFLEMRAYA